MQSISAQTSVTVLPSNQRRCSRLSCASRKRILRQAGVVQTRAGVSQPNPLENAINALQVRILNSPLNEGKKRFFRSLAGNYDQQAVQAKIQSLIDENPVVVFSWTVCPFAKRAKAILTEAGAKYLAVELDKIPDGKAIKAELGFMTNRTSVPNVFIGGKSIGGCNDGNPGLVSLLEQGQLDKMLREVQAI